MQIISDPRGSVSTTNNRTYRRYLSTVPVSGRTFHDLWTSEDDSCSYVRLSVTFCSLYLAVLKPYPPLSSSELIFPLFIRNKNIYLSHTISPFLALMIYFTTSNFKFFLFFFQIFAIFHVPLFLPYTIVCKIHPLPREESIFHYTYCIGTILHQGRKLMCLPDHCAHVPALFLYYLLLWSTHLEPVGRVSWPHIAHAGAPRPDPWARAAGSPHIGTRITRCQASTTIHPTVLHLPYANPPKKS